MGLRGKQLVKGNFTMEIAVDKLESLYEEIVSARSYGVDL